MRFFSNSALLQLAILFALSLLSAANLVNVNVIRDIDLKALVTREKTRLVALNSGNADQSNYIFLVPDNVKSRLSVLSAIDIKSSDPLLVTKLGYNEERKADEYSVRFSTPLKPNEKASIKIEATFTRKFEAYPEEISLDDDAYYKYSRNIYLESLYQTKKQKTILTLPNSVTLSHSDKPSPVAIKNNELTYGPYLDKDISETAVISVIFHDTVAHSRFASSKRVITISHFSNTLSVADNNVLVNDSPRITDYDKSKVYLNAFLKKTKNSLIGLNTAIPFDAHNIFYTDRNGNVSTSAISEIPRKSGRSSFKILQINPRYSIMGGWKYGFNAGYYSKLSNFLRYDSNTGVYNLKIDFMGLYMDIGSDYYELVVVLPEGATDIKTIIPFDVDSETISTVYKHLDFFGRKQVLIKKKNVSTELSTPIIVSYKLPGYNQIVKPVKTKSE
ncbi:Dolichyl-diphosphooligosaccharide-protein glycosyltransferase subunit 1 [Smittium culicis]|uniref:Dolichyl-diphosphooligosaccharide--protein glycosyltransferase subunit 1 n=1 Tax=Smittium culicis TaxID=133412 RepID=A0A1R1XQD9_9FUNG|nr:Dolichyl-diphosphooligosaccharide-protein glycosyltransferase subunit 1 [Smittium culicis]